MKNKRALVYIAAVLGIAALMAVVVWIKQLQRTGTETQAAKTEFIMDTVVEIRASGPDAEAAVDAAFAEMSRVEKVFSRHLKDSAITRINQGSGQWVPVTDEVMALLEKALHYSELSSGAFDITVGRLIDLWGFGTDKQKIPPETELAQALATVGYRSVEIDKSAKMVRIPSGTIIDLGGIAKGYAVDQARKVLEAKGVKSGMIYAGGDITTIGAKPDGSSWRVGVQHPRESTALIGIVEMENKTIVTSGDYERYFMDNGIRYHHIIDPHTGYPARDVISVTIYGSEAADADALSTTIFVLGLERGKALIENLPGYEAVIVDQEGNVWVSSGLAGQITLL